MSHRCCFILKQFWPLFRTFRRGTGGEFDDIADDYLFNNKDLCKYSISFRQDEYNNNKRNEVNATPRVFI